MRPFESSDRTRPIVICGENGLRSFDMSVRSEVGGVTRVVETEHIPLMPSREIGDGMLMVERDITATVLAQERRERNMKQLVET
ncbi:MAG: hypothetical protein IH987_08435, partial [Planctomycetes bacterium]|nr:hypothetical protein [Planctomycetota bacterium]